jgi:predicted nucleotidyltransferase
MQATIKEHSAELAQLCREHHVRRLEVFGSALRSDFDPVSSDLDFLVEFKHVSPAVYARSYFSLKEALEALFKRPVDLITPASLENPYFRASLVASCERVYAA